MRSIARALVVAGLLAASPAIAQEKLIAIDVLIEPDQRMLGEAAKWNARMREQIPDGLALDAQHRPHITLIQRFVSEADLP